MGSLCFFLSELITVFRTVILFWSTLCLLVEVELTATNRVSKNRNAAFFFSPITLTNVYGSCWKCAFMRMNASVMVFNVSGISPVVRQVVDRILMEGQCLGQVEGKSCQSGETLTERNRKCWSKFLHWILTTGNFRIIYFWSYIGLFFIQWIQFILTLSTNFFLMYSKRCFLSLC